MPGPLHTPAHKFEPTKHERDERDERDEETQFEDEHGDYASQLLSGEPYDWDEARMRKRTRGW